MALSTPDGYRDIPISSLLHIGRVGAIYPAEDFQRESRNLAHFGGFTEVCRIWSRFRFSRKNIMREKKYPTLLPR